MPRIKRLFSLFLVFVIIFGVAIPVDAKSKSISIKAKNVTYSKSSYNLDSKDSVTCYEIHKIKTSSKDNIFNFSSDNLVKGYNTYCFDKKIIKKIDKYKKSNKKLKFTYTNVDSKSKYYDKFIVMESGQLMLSDVYTLFTKAATATGDLKDLIEKYMNDKQLSESEREVIFIQIMNIIYKDKNVTFNSFDDYKKYLFEIAKNSVVNSLKKSIVITKVKVVK